MSSPPGWPPGNPGMGWKNPNGASSESAGKGQRSLGARLSRAPATGRGGGSLGAVVLSTRTAGVTLADTETLRVRGPNPSATSKP